MFKKIGIIGAGTMGAQLAAMFAGAGCEVELLNVVLDGAETESERRALGERTIKRIVKSRPPALYSSGDVKRIRTGNVEDHLDRLADCDWVLEAIVEKLDAKRALLDRIEDCVGPDTLISSNTSSLSLAKLAEGRSNDIRRRLFISHFFNPPRYLKLVEIVAGPGIDERLISAMSRFLSRELGKGVIRAKDTPAFIANRVGIFYVMDNFHLVAERGWPIEAVDAVLGRASGRPRSGVFRLMDMVGLDIVASVAETVFKGCPHDESVDRFRIPQYLQHMIVNGWVGRKAGRGFFMKCEETKGIKVIDPATLQYRSQSRFRTPALDEAPSILSSRSRMERTVMSDCPAGEIAWPAVSRTLAYAAKRVPEITTEIADVDRALRWGFNWDLGPFETWDALGVRRVAKRLESDGVEIPEMVERMLSAGCDSFYEWRGSRGMIFDVGAGRMLPMVERRPFTVSLSRESGGVVQSGESASLVDMGDGVFACEFHSRANTIDVSTLDAIDRSIERVEREGVGLLIVNEGEYFSAGADLKAILEIAERRDWDGMDALVRRFQSTGQRIRFSTRPVIAVPFSKVLGGGCELCLAAAGSVATIETYMGLVEMAVGLVPAGGGCKNLLLALEGRERLEREGRSGLWGSPDDGGPGPREGAAFELIATARTSTSAVDARELGYLKRSDPIIYDGDLRIERAKRHLIKFASGYEAPAPREEIVVSGRGGEMNMLSAIRSYLDRGLATEYDAFVAKKLARVLTDGEVPCVHNVSEERILDLEREAFLSLVGEERTIRRIEHILKTGKSLRN